VCVTTLTTHHPGPGISLAPHRASDGRAESCCDTHKFTYQQSANLPTSGKGDAGLIIDHSGLFNQVQGHAARRLARSGGSIAHRRRARIVLEFLALVTRTRTVPSIFWPAHHTAPPASGALFRRWDRERRAEKKRPVAYMRRSLADWLGHRLTRAATTLADRVAGLQLEADREGLVSRGSAARIERPARACRPREREAGGSNRPSRPNWPGRVRRAGSCGNPGSRCRLLCGKKL
jgi:hypothetical protein